MTSPRFLLLLLVLFFSTSQSVFAQSIGNGSWSGTSCYVDTGHGLMYSPYSLSSDAQITTWEVRLYRVGQAAGGKDFWGLILGKSAADVMSQLKQSQEVEKACDQFMNYYEKPGAWTNFNSVGPIAVIHTKNTVEDGAAESANASQTLGSVFKQVVELKRKLDEVEEITHNRGTLKSLMNEPETGLMGYLSALKDARDQAVALRRKLDDLNGKSTAEIQAALGGVQSDLDGLNGKLASLNTGGNQSVGALHLLGQAELDRIKGEPYTWTEYAVSGSGTDTASSTVTGDVSQFAEDLAENAQGICMQRSKLSWDESALASATALGAPLYEDMIQIDNNGIREMLHNLSSELAQVKPSVAACVATLVDQFDVSGKAKIPTGSDYVQVWSDEFDPVKQQLIAKIPPSTLKTSPKQSPKFKAALAALKSTGPPAVAKPKPASVVAFQPKLLASLLRQQHDHMLKVAAIVKQNEDKQQALQQQAQQAQQEAEQQAQQAQAAKEARRQALDSDYQTLKNLVGPQDGVGWRAKISAVDDDSITVDIGVNRSDQNEYWSTETIKWNKLDPSTISPGVLDVKNSPNLPSGKLTGVNIFTINNENIIAQVMEFQTATPVIQQHVLNFYLADPSSQDAVIAALKDIFNRLGVPSQASQLITPGSDTTPTTPGTSNTQEADPLQSTSLTDVEAWLKTEVTQSAHDDVRLSVGGDRWTKTFSISRFDGSTVHETLVYYVNTNGPYQTDYTIPLDQLDPDQVQVVEKDDAAPTAYWVTFASKGGNCIQFTSSANNSSGNASSTDWDFADKAAADKVAAVLAHAIRLAKVR